MFKIHNRFKTYFFTESILGFYNNFFKKIEKNNLIGIFDLGFGVNYMFKKNQFFFRIFPLIRKTEDVKSHWLSFGFSNK